MWLVGELLRKRAAPKPFRQIKAFVYLIELRVDAGVSSSKHQPGGSILLFLSQEMAGARPGGERAVDHSV